MWDTFGIEFVAWNNRDSGLIEIVNWKALAVAKSRLQMLVCGQILVANAGCVFVVVVVVFSVYQAEETESDIIVFVDHVLTHASQFHLLCRSTKL